MYIYIYTYTYVYMKISVYIYRCIISHSLLANVPFIYIISFPQRSCREEFFSHSTWAAARSWNKEKKASWIHGISHWLVHMSIYYPCIIHLYHPYIVHISSIYYPDSIQIVSRSYPCTVQKLCIYYSYTYVMYI